MSQLNRRNFIFLATMLCTFCAQHLFAQAVLEPLRFNSKLENTFSSLNKRGITAETDTIAVGLPFFDDFTGYKYRNNTSPDTSNWVQGGGTFINNSFPVQPPTYNVATFDGIKEDGTPYNFSNSNMQGQTDSLQSRPIKLDTLNPALSNTVYLSFYWQAGGLASQLAPNDDDDSLVVQFRDTAGTWQWIWSVSRQSNKPFNQAILQVPAAFHGPAFQFRFVNYAQMNGNFDIWHVDYVYLNSNRNAGDTLFANREEFTVSIKPQNFLREYTAMPYDHFKVSPAGTTLDSINTFVNLLGPSETPFRYRASLAEKNSNTFIKEYTNIPFPDIRTPANFVTQLRYTIPVEEQLLKNFVQQPVEFEYTFTIDSVVHPTGDFRYNNDTARSVVSLQDYYAYDDGSAELTYYMGGNFGQTAVKFFTPFEDTINNIRIHYSKSVDNINNQPFTIKVWKYLKGINGQDKDSLLAQINVNVNYTDQVNGFTEIRLPSIAVSDTFYIGWLQNTGGSQAIRVGFDINSAPQHKTFQNFGGAWQPFNLTNGSVMIQPVFRNPLVASSKDNSGLSKVDIYPNPATIVINIDGEVKEVFLYDLSGKLLISHGFENNSSKQLDISQLKPGMYILQIWDKNKSKSSHKLIVSDK